MMEKESRLLSLLEECGAVQYGSFVLSSGKKSDYYVDVKRACSVPSVLKEIASMMSDIISGIDVDWVAGVELGAVPIATAVSLETGLPMIMIRKQAKEHGIKDLIVGDLQAGDRIVLVEDVTTTGGSVVKGIEAIRSAGGVIETVVAVVDREEGASENLENQDVRLLSLVSAAQLLRKHEKIKNDFL